MWSTAREIAPGDLVIIWLTRDELQPLLITPGKDFSGKFGVYSHSDLVGLPYGSKVGSRTGRGFIHVLRPTPELWTMALPHRTQILYLADIAFIVSYLDIKPGSCVIEAGTGSGSFSHSVARTIGDSGHLYSYEFHESRANKAREEFHEHGISDRITLTHRNVCKDGFTVTDCADSVFLDLPAPWEAIENAKKALRKDRTTRICCFSPCMEQVMRTVTALNDAGFTDITMYETLLRPHEVHTPPPLRPVSEVAADLRQAALVREQKRLLQIAASDARRAQQAASGDSPNRKRKRGAVAPGRSEKDGSGTSKLSDMTTAAESKKPRREEEHGDVPATATSASLDPDSEPSALNENSTATSHKTAAQPPTLSTALNVATSAAAPSEPDLADMKQVKKEEIITVVPEPPQEALSSNEKGEKAGIRLASGTADAPSKVMAVSKVLNEVRGHTSYLTFAVLLPAAFKPSSDREGVSVSDRSGETNDSSATSVVADVPTAGDDVREIGMADAGVITSATDGVAPVCSSSIDN